MKHQILVFFFSALLILYDVSALSSDGRTLLSLLRHWNFVPTSINSSWMASNSTPCSWVGIQCSHAHNVVSLNLTSKDIFGQLGPEIGQLHHLQSLVLLNNSFSGKIPSEIGNCSLLEHLDLSKNSFSGQIPNELGMLNELRDLDLSFNRLTGEIPVKIWRVQSLQHVLVHNNSLFGELPLEMTELKHLRNISLFDNQFSGVIPQSLGINSSLVRLDVFNNRFSGNIPPHLCYGNKLSVLSMGFNQLEGGVPSDMGRCASLRRLVLRKNNLTGSLPYFESNLNLQYMDIGENKITGEIPPSLKNCSNLMEIRLSMNKFIGLIPSELGKLTNLLILDLAHNNLVGPLPSLLSNCTIMDRFDVGFNALNSSIPSSLRSWTRLSTLILEENRFTGSIPDFWSEFNNLLELRIGGNLFTGEIPKSMGKLYNLMYGLNLSDNRLTGVIPWEIVGLKKLVSLDVSLNNLTGCIDVLGELGAITEFNISYNSFTGCIPENLIKFHRSPPSSFKGNSGLHVCSPSGGLSCPKICYLQPCVNKFNDYNHKRISKFVIVMIAIGSSIFVSVVLLLPPVLKYLHRRSMQEINASVEEEGSSSSIYVGRGSNEHVVQINKQIMIRTEKHLSFLVLQAMKVTNNLNDSYIVGGGAHGIVYKVQLGPDQVLSAKKIAFSMNKGKSNCKLREITVQEIQIAGMINHPNLAKYIGYWFGKDYGVILYKYMENGSLHDALHIEKNPLPPLKWNNRLKIAVGVAQGLEYMHYDFRPPIVHRDIKPKNILLGFDMEPVITDFGTAVHRRWNEHSSLNETRQRLSSSIAGTIGYIAPEIAYSVVASRKSDVYSYGVVLLELITRKRVLDQSFVEQETSLVRWVRSVYGESQNIEEIVDSGLMCEFSQSIVVKQVTALLDLALRCTEREPTSRPTMREVISFYRNHMFRKLRYDAVDTKITADITNKYDPNNAWRFPPEGWVKVNTHGCVNEFGQAGCGGVIRGDGGEWLRGFTMSLRPCLNVVAEIWGIYHGLTQAWDLQFPRVIIETDSLTASQLLQEKASRKLYKFQPYAYPVALCHELIERDWEVKLQYIVKEGNVCAGWLANYSFGPCGENHIYQQPPRELEDFLHQDISGAAGPIQNTL